MEIKGINYIGPLFDYSGYGQASRGNVLALYKKGIPIRIEPMSFEHDKSDLGEDGRILKSLMNNDIDYNINIIHSTPEFWSKYRKVDKVNVGYTIWETTQLHVDWPVYINKNVDKVLVGSEWNIDVFKNSGVTIPIGVVPHGIDMSRFDKPEPYHIKGVTDDTFVFYSIFQWTERKNPLAAVKAYWSEFNSTDNVALVLKTYRGDYTEGEKRGIKETILKLKEVTPMYEYPKIYFISDMLSDEEIYGLHARGDCYVSLDRGEGFGLSPFFAGASGNPIIVTGFGGVTEYATHTNSFLIDYFLEPVFGMPWSPWYRGEQMWAYPNISQAAKTMRTVYENRSYSSSKGRLLKENIAEHFTWDHIGQKLIDELEKM